MNLEALFCSLTPSRLAELVRSAQQAVCYAGPGIQLDLAQAMVEVAGRVGKEMLTVSLDFDDRVMRMGYGNVDAVKRLLDAGITVQSSPGLRTALAVVDNEGYIFTPTALYLEAEPTDGAASNAVRMSGEQVAQALARLSPAAKTIAIAQAKTPEAKQRIEVLTVDVVSAPITPEKLAEVAASLKEAPPVRFDLARQVRVFEPYLQYVELSLTGAAIQRHRMAIPEKIQKLGGSKELENRLRTTFELIEKGSKLSSKPLEDALNEIRKNFTPSLGKDHGRVVLKAAKPHLVTRLKEFRIIQSIPSPKAEPFKRWLAKVGKERLDEIENPELAMGRMQELYEKKGYPKEWIDKRLRGIAVRQDLTDEWKQRGVTSSQEFAILTNEIMQGTFALRVDEYKQVKALARENLRDHMTDIELILTMLGEATTTKLHRDRDSVGMPKLKKDAKDGGAVAGRTRKDIEQQSGKPVISPGNFKQLAAKPVSRVKKIKGSEG